MADEGTTALSDLLDGIKEEFDRKLPRVRWGSVTREEVLKIQEEAIMATVSRLYLESKPVEPERGQA